MSEKINQYFLFLVEHELPIFYLLAEVIFIFWGAKLFFHGIWLIRSLRSLNMSYSQMTYVASDTNGADVLLKIFAGVMLMAFGVSHAMIVNSFYISSAEVSPYSVEIFRSMSCANGMTDGCITYDIGLYDSQNWQKSIINMSFYNVVIGAIQLSGAIAYGIGWSNIAKLKSPNVRGQMTSAGGCMVQIVLGAMAMHPLKLYHLIV